MITASQTNKRDKVLELAASGKSAEEIATTLFKVYLANEIDAGLEAAVNNGNVSKRRFWEAENEHRQSSIAYLLSLGIN